MPKPLNIVLITSHDIGRRLGCYGDKGVRSPNLDQLADDGAVLEQAFCTQTQCSPSRSSIYTGRYPHSNGVMGLTHGDFKWDLHADEVHLAGLLKQAGYQTALAGLQHETGRPTEMGFDTIDQNETKWAKGVVDACDRRLAAFADQPEKPFYLQVGFFEGHRAPGHSNHEWGPMPSDDEAPISVPGYLRDEPGVRAELAQQSGSIRSMDVEIGRFLAALDDAGHRDDTLVIFTADHGIPFPRAKTSLYDPGLEVTMLMRGPADLVKPAQRHDALISNVDLLPTICELADLPCPERVQGCSFAGLLRGESNGPREEIFGEQTYHNYADPMRCVRTKDFKLIVNFMPCAAIYNSTQQWRPVATTVVPDNPKDARHSVVELYDLRNDPLEQRNLADHPEFAKTRADLLARLRRHLLETEDPILEGLPLPKRFREAQSLLGVS